MNWTMNLPSGIHFRTVAPMIIEQMKLWDARSPHIDRASDLGYKVTQKRELPDPCLCQRETLRRVPSAMCLIHVLAIRFVSLQLCSVQVRM